MRNLCAKLAVAALLVSCLPSIAAASDARVRGMGLQSDFLQDYVNVMYYPQSIARYPNLVYGDLGVKDVSGGDISSFSDNGFPDPIEGSGRAMGAFVTAKWLPGVWGVMLNENNSPVSPAYGADYYNRNSNQAFTLLWGQQFETVALGLSVSRANSSLQDDTDTLEPYDWFPGSWSVIGDNAREIMNIANFQLGTETRNSWGFGGGASFSWDAYGRTHSADVSAQYRTLSLELSDPTATLEDNGNNQFAINGRAQIATSDNTYLVPLFNWYTMQLGTKLTDTVTPANNFEYENKVSGVQIGLANGWVLRDQDLLMLGVSFGFQSIDYEDPNANGIDGEPFELSYNQTPVLFGSFESRPTNWLAFRLGASKPMFSKFEYTNLTASETVEISDAPLQYAVGLGFRIGGRLDVDTVLNQDFPFTGGWASSGQEETPFSRISATYRW